MSKIEPVTIVFEEPIDVDVAGEQRTFTEITFRRKLKGKDTLRQEQAPDGVRSAWALYASMSGTPIQLFEEMDSEIFEEVVTKTAHLMGKNGKRNLEKLRKKQEAELAEQQ